MVTLNTFLPDALGATVPVKLQPRLVAALKAPPAAMLSAMVSPVRLVVDHTPAIVARDAGVA